MIALDEVASALLVYVNARGHWPGCYTARDPLNGIGGGVCDCGMNVLLHALQPAAPRRGTQAGTPREFGLRQTINGCSVEVSSEDRVAAAKTHILLGAAPALLKFVERFILSSTTGLPYVEGEPSLLDEDRALLANGATS